MAALVVLLALSLVAGSLWLEYRRRQRAEIESRRYLTTMAELDRRAAMGHLTASLAHELRQPLGAILRNAEAAQMILASQSPSIGELQEIVDDIRNDDKRAVEIIRRVKTMLQPHDLEAAPVDINDVAKETVDFMTPDAAARGARLQVELQRSPLLVTGDRVHLQQALLNLVLNGLDAMAHTPPEQRLLVVSTVANNGYAEVAVQDRGAGLPNGAATRIFEPFFSTKPEGMGMGLSIARTIVEAHHGRLIAENNADLGATVRFRLPVSH
jgi:signal transduction histidine kinase